MVRQAGQEVMARLDDVQLAALEALVATPTEGASSSAGVHALEGSDHFDETKPRRVRLSRDQDPIFIFTDGSCEDQGEEYPEAEVGGVIYDPTDGFVEAFGGKLPPEVVAKFSPEESNG